MASQCKHVKKLETYRAPFEVAIGVYLVMIVFVLWKWKENYGDREAKATASFVSAVKVLRTGEVIWFGKCNA